MGRYHADVEVGSVERMLRETPGVLDCSVSDEGIAVVVHPEVDPRMLELRIQASLAELGDRRPLLVVGGMSTAGGAFTAVPRSLSQARRPGMRPPGLPRSRSSMPILGFAVLVVAAITLVPLAGRDSSAGRERSPAEGQVAAPAPASAPPSATDVLGAAGSRPSFGPLPVVDEVLPAALAPVVRTAPAAAAVFQAAGRSFAAEAPPPVASATGTTVGTAAPVVTPPPPAAVGPGRSAAARGDKAEPSRGKGAKRAEVAAAGLGDDKPGKGPKAGKGGKDKGRGRR